MVKRFNTAVCKTATRGFESHSDLLKKQSKFLWVVFLYNKRVEFESRKRCAETKCKHRRGQSRELSERSRVNAKRFYATSET